jgi:hypothetical protein
MKHNQTAPQIKSNKKTKYTALCHSMVERQEDKRVILSNTFITQKQYNKKIKNNKYVERLAMRYGTQIREIIHVRCLVFVRQTKKKKNKKNKNKKN